MKKKMVGIFVCTLLIMTAVLPVTGIMNDNKTLREAYTDYSNSMQQTIDRGRFIEDWSEEAKILASDSAANDAFGFSVSIDEDYAIVGAYRDDDHGSWSGSAYVFKRDGAGWSEDVKLLASDGAAGDCFGWSVSIDGDYAIIGAIDDDSSKGSAYVFKRTGTTWTEEAKLTASDSTPGDKFGYSVSIDGDYALVGAFWDDDKGSYSGSAYVFKRTGTTWSEEAKLTASDSTPGDWFGLSVSIDGDYTIIGAAYKDYYTEENIGSVYVFKRDGASWSEEAKLLASDGAAHDQFGHFVSIDRDYAIIGAPYDASVYVFKRTGTTWTEEAKLTASDGPEVNLFGWDGSIDGDYALVGAFWDDDKGEDSGSAYIFKRTGTTWTEGAKLTASDGAKMDYFGQSVSIDGDYAFAGAYRDDDRGKNSGSTYIFRKLDPNAPDAPDVNGPIGGVPGTEYNFNFVTTDPNGDDISYYVDWGDDTTTGWTDFAPSGNAVTLTHTWDEKGTYTVKAKAKDTYGIVSGWGTLTVTMPRNKIATNSLFLRLLEQFPYAFPILRHILGLQ